MNPAMRENIVRRALELEGWFTKSQLYAVAGDRDVALVLGDLVAEGQLERSLNRRSRTMMFRWVND